MNIKRSDLVDLLAEIRPSLPDQRAAKYIAMYPIWKPGLEITQADIDARKNRYQWDDKLNKCIQPHTTQEGWEPGIKTAALWTVIDVTHSGTIDDPIPAVAGMEYEYGKYYIEGSTIYICQRTGEAEGGKITLNYLPSELVGQYFAEV